MYTVTLKAAKASRKILQVIDRVSSMPKSEKKCLVWYGGGISSTKAALESDTRVLAFEAGRKKKIRVNTILLLRGSFLGTVLAFEAGRKKKIRVNTISAGPLGSRAAKAIVFIDTMIDYSYANAPL
ncbi:enoyl-ACP reductase [Artemisia annua]|uniref:Enoyl-ACP reductase n=1 Tax=Artemisia annua TaxID=35608 RepID=A0A2U1M9K1_ARTAN|nr:enoyl-ACP reductase [Artemisia annua]